MKYLITLNELFESQITKSKNKHLKKRLSYLLFQFKRRKKSIGRIYYVFVYNTCWSLWNNNVFAKLASEYWMLVSFLTCRFLCVFLKRYETKEWFVQLTILYYAHLWYFIILFNYMQYINALFIKNLITNSNTLVLFRIRVAKIRC